MDIWTIFFVLITSLAVTQACPGVCSCDGAQQLVNCSARGLTVVPLDVPTTVQHLLLDRNNLTAVGEPEICCIY